MKIYHALRRSIVAPSNAFKIMLCASLIASTTVPYQVQADDNKESGSIASTLPLNSETRLNFQKFLRELSESGFNPSGAHLPGSGDLENAIANMPEDDRSDSEQADAFDRWIESLRHSAFSMGSANPNSLFFENHPLDTFALLGQQVLLKKNQEPQFAMVDPRRITAEVINSANIVESQISPKDARGANTSHFSTGPANPNKRYNLRISYQGKSLHLFQNNIQSVAFIGPYLFFYEPSKLSSEQRIANLSFIDLRQFTPALGKTVLPLFRMPVKIKDDQSLAALELNLVGDNLEFGGNKISIPVIDEFSNMQSSIFNATVSLVSPGSFASTSLVLDEMLDSMLDAAKDSASLLTSDFENAGVDREMWSQFTKTIVEETKKRKSIGASTKDPEQASKVRKELEAAKKRLIENNLTEVELRLIDELNKEIGARNDETSLDRRAEILATLAEKIKADPSKNILKTLKFSEDLAVDNGFQEKIREYDTAIAGQRKLLNRVHLLWIKLFMPKPLGAPRIQRALGLAAAGAISKDTFATTGFTRSKIPMEVLQRLAASKTVRVATPVIAGAVMAYMFPVEASQLAHSALDSARVVLDSTLGWVSDFQKLLVVTWDKSWAFLNPSNINTAFIADGRLAKTAFGVGSIIGTLLATVYSAHLMVNSIVFLKKLKQGLAREATQNIETKMAKEDAAENKSFITNKFIRLAIYPFRWTRESIVTHMRNSKNDYYALLASAEAKKTESKGIFFTEEDNLEVEKIIHEIKTHVKQETDELVAATESPLITKMENKTESQIQTLAGAIKQLLFGYSSWTNTTVFFGRVWNPWFLIRNFWTKPRTVLTMLAYPNYYGRSVWGGSKTVEGYHFPTYQNGGLRPWWNFGPFRVLATSDGTKQALRDLDAYEKQIIEVEKKIHAESVKLAWVEMMRFAGKDPSIVEVLKTGAILDAHDPRIKKLSGSTRMFFMAFFTETFNRSMKYYLADELNLSHNIEHSDESLKAAALKASVKPKISDEEAKQLVAKVATEQYVRGFALRTSQKLIGGLLDRITLDHNQKVSESLDPKYNGSLKRAKIATTQLDKPEAVARATRKYMTSIIVDKPMEIMILLLMYAGIQDGSMLQPVHDEINGPNSINYMSNYIFWNGWFVGIMISLLADVWMKVQTDYRLDSINGFDDVPEGKDKDKSYMSWYGKQVVHKDNTWWKNYSYNLRLSFINMPAYFLTALTTNLIFLGRFDLDAFLMVYITLLFPTTGFFDKFENAFEKASNWVVRKFPRKYHSHPRVQEYRANTLGPMRVYFQVVYNLFGNVIDNITTTLSLISEATIGPRSFARMLFFGFTPTEIVAHGIDKVDKVSGGVASGALDACDKFFTNNYTDGAKLPK